MAKSCGCSRPPPPPPPPPRPHPHIHSLCPMLLTVPAGPKRNGTPTLHRKPHMNLQWLSAVAGCSGCSPPPPTTTACSALHTWPTSAPYHSPQTLLFQNHPAIHAPHRPAVAECSCQVLWLQPPHQRLQGTEGCSGAAGLAPQHLQQATGVAQRERQARCSCIVAIL